MERFTKTFIIDAKAFVKVISLRSNSVMRAMLAFTKRYGERCGSSSVGRAIAFQAIGREFEPRFPLRVEVGGEAGSRLSRRRRKSGSSNLVSRSGEQLCVNGLKVNRILIRLLTINK